MSVAARTTNPGAVEHTSEQALGIQEALIQTASGQGNVAMLKQAAVHSATKWVKDKLETKTSLLDVADKQYEVPKVTPLLTYVILIFNISLYIAGLALRFGKGESSAEDYFYMLALVDEEVAHGEYYRLLTSSFMHDSFQHLALNVFALFQIAPEVESVLGYQTFLAVYLLAGLGGSTATFIFGDTITVGASSCIFGLIGAMGGYLWKNRSVQSQGQLTLVGLVVAVNLVMGSKDSSSIDNLGHVAGLFSGLYLGWGMAPRLVAPPQSADADNTAASSQQQQKTTNASLERQSSMGGNLRTQRDTPVSQSNKQTSAKEQPPSVPKIKAIDSITAIQRWAIPMTFGTINVLLLAVTVQERTGILPMPKGLGL
jgi:rhomboid protease GluP